MSEMGLKQTRSGRFEFLIQFPVNECELNSINLLLKYEIF